MGIGLWSGDKRISHRRTPVMSGMRDVSLGPSLLDRNV